MHQRGSTSAPKKHLRSLLVPPQTISKRKILKEPPRPSRGGFICACKAFLPAAPFQAHVRSDIRISATCGP